MSPPAIVGRIVVSRRMVIAAVCQPLAASPSNSVSAASASSSMKRLRIELAPEGFDLLGVQRMRGRNQSRAHVNVFQVQPV